MNMKKFICSLLIFVLLFSLTGCIKTDAVEPASAPASGLEITNDLESEKAHNDTEAEEISETVEEDGIYDGADEVSLYIVTYHKLPGNYITKKEARQLGWEGGSLEEYAPGKCIGGDVFGNREGVLPEGQLYYECDIGTLGKEKRGAKRLVYSDDYEVYYTEDHYNSFTQLY